MKGGKMLRKFMEEAVIPCLSKAGVNFLVSGQTVIFPASDMTRLRALDPDARWPIGDLVFFGETVVYVSHTGDQVKEIVGQAFSTPDNLENVVISFSLKRKKI